jgi:precorrin-2 dehydrogenase
MFYPVYLNLKNKRVVVVGGGAVAERKVESLLGTEASINLISPEVTSRLEALAESGQIQLQRRAYAAGDCAGAALVFSATDDVSVSRAVFEEATAIGALVNTADKPALCDCRRPAWRHRRRRFHRRNKSGPGGAVAR